MRQKRLIAWAAATFLSCATICGVAQGAPRGIGAAEPNSAMLETGFQNLYELNFQEARVDFRAYQTARPNDPLGKTAEAASYLYAEFNAKGVFSSKFFLNDSKLLGGVDGKPSQNRNQAFLDVNDQARQMAKKILQSNPRDVNGLLALTIADGMESDYDALIEKKQMDGLTLMRRAESEANTLLAIDPTAQDAYVALGASNYIIGCLPAYKRLFLRIGGIHGDKARGMQEMEIAAEHGRYLRPFAKILLALAYEREHQMDRARSLLAELTTQFPANPLFARELALTEQYPSRKR
ncbi:MAG: hypothetical protein ACRD4C_00865 [Candidatus Acidiferrales bacterium]